MALLSILYYYHLAIANGNLTPFELSNTSWLYRLTCFLFGPFAGLLYPGASFYAPTAIPSDVHVPSYVADTWERRRSSAPACRKEKNLLDSKGEIPFELRTENLPYMNSDRAKRDVEDLLQAAGWDGCKHAKCREGDMRCLGKHFGGFREVSYT